MARVLLRTIRSRKRFITAGSLVVKELEKTLDQVVKPELVKRFQHIVANWDSDVDFKARKRIESGSISVFVFPTGSDKQIYLYVTGGTKPHKIRAKKGPYLAYMWGGKGSYKPKTKPPGKIGGPGTVTNATLRRPAEVDHPGSEARDFEAVIMEDFTPWFRRQMENAFRRGIRKAAIA